MPSCGVLENNGGLMTGGSGEVKIPKPAIMIAIRPEISITVNAVCILADVSMPTKLIMVKTITIANAQ